MKARAKNEIKQDCRLAKGLLRGKLCAWEKFYNMYAEPLYRYLLVRLSGDTEAAADITQETIVLAVECVRTFEVDKGSLWSWLCGIAMNKIRECQRDAAQAAKLQERLRDGDRCRKCTLGDEANAHNVKLVLSELNPRHQEVLIHKYVEGQSMKDIAKAIGISEKAVESRLTRGREAFRTEYARLLSSKEVSQDG